MTLEIKLAAFDHVVYRLTEWYAEDTPSCEVKNDLSRLKITKLLFFVSAISTTSTEVGLLRVFDTFAALPYGHVESDIQDNMQNSPTYNITRESLSFKLGINHYLQPQPQELSLHISSMIDSAVNFLKKSNPRLIHYNAFDLVDLSHRWQSWITIFSLAKKNGKFSMLIPNEMIMKEPKIFK